MASKKKSSAFAPFRACHLKPPNAAVKLLGIASAGIATYLYSRKVENRTDSYGMNMLKMIGVPVIGFYVGGNLLIGEGFSRCKSELLDLVQGMDTGVVAGIAFTAYNRTQRDRRMQAAQIQAASRGGIPAPSGMRIPAPGVGAPVTVP